MGMKAIAIRHVPFEDIGSLGPVLEERGFSVEYREAGIDLLASAELDNADLLVILGGPIGAYEENSYPFLIDELKLLENRLSASRPTLGLCLGSQLMARVLGAQVYAGPQKEIGWGSIQLTEEGEASPLRHLGSAAHTQVLHWHGDTFDLPVGAVRLASSRLYENQAFSYGTQALALQFHPEVTPSGMERWFIGHAHEITHTAGIGVAALREATQRNGPALQIQGSKVFSEWLDTALATE